MRNVIALHQKALGTDKLAALRTFRMAGTIRFLNQAVGGSVVTCARGLTDYATTIDLGRSGRIKTIVADGRGWSASSFDPTREMKGEYLRGLQRMHPLIIAADWRTMTDEIALEGVKPFDDRPHYVLRAKIADDFKSTIYIDVATGLVTAEDFVVATPGLGGLPMHVRYRDYRDVAGVMLPAHIEIHNDFHGNAVIECEALEANIELPADAFAEPPAQIE